MINFLKYRWLYFLISLVVVGLGILSMVMWGYTYSIDFVGGTNLEYQLDKNLTKEQVKSFFADYKLGVDSSFIDNNILYLRLKPMSDKKEAELKQDLEKNFNIKINTLRFETLGPLIGKETIKKTITASILAIIGILLYMTFAFRNFNFAAAAIAALGHDFLVVVGSYSIISNFFSAELDLLFVTALLTTMSFSVHDTIVIFDKIREYGTADKSSIEIYANKALTETMVRSVNNSMTILFMLLALLILGGSTIKYFIAVLLIGTITGTYSSPFVATPFLVWLEKSKNQK
ncbi:hypothetical protein A2774_00435 [Candidatus Roizmanbacteria bacterium RIFCSPHIGHO2_01_FULL_39_12c]|uniref:Protein-export membrane protein SecF n=1 Tax=Candidatus Roizmanbacteria bacterium RIFCSPHIGHO2_01_FULL_39_12c TaxID=1802031 RepID=A0A1F7GDA6_9BACT|nr:MAG: hypothetical protein A2774_00435 [Candidatus Roizmanbacteria bacterium RIFCSPHIGHO2_01_FULL_39_12c]